MRQGQKTLQARRLRRDMTEAEQRLWRFLRMRQLAGHRFRRQHPIGPYIADFACLDAGMVVEVDGGQHADAVSDVERDAYLRHRGFVVLRFWNHDVLQNMTGVVEAIMHHLDLTPPHPGLPPQAGEGDKRSVEEGERRSAGEGDRRSVEEGERRSAREGDKRSVEEGERRSAGRGDRRSAGGGEAQCGRRRQAQRGEAGILRKKEMSVVGKTAPSPAQRGRVGVGVGPGTGGDDDV